MSVTTSGGAPGAIKVLLVIACRAIGRALWAHRWFLAECAAAIAVNAAIWGFFAFLGTRW
jgi:hypothetical protein